MAEPLYLDKIAGLRKGAAYALKIARPVKVKKGQPSFTKHTRTTIRAGINYDNMKAVQQGRADGALPEENQGLPYGEWYLFPYVIVHKGEYHYRFATSEIGRMETFYTDAEGNRVDREVVKASAYASEFAERDQPMTVFNVKETNIVSFGLSFEVDGDPEPEPVAPAIAA